MHVICRGLIWCTSA